jgi:hypothetical protein
MQEFTHTPGWKCCVVPLGALRPTNPRMKSSDESNAVIPYTDSRCNNLEC